jgi:Na+/proline symporter
LAGYQWVAAHFQTLAAESRVPESLLVLGNLNGVDYGVLLIYLAAMLGLGYFFSGQQKTTEDFFLGGRAFSWFPIGLSLMATLISAMSYTGLPGQAFDHGLMVLIHPLSVWIALPIIVGVVVPIYRGLKLCSVYEYLELRFDGRVRLLASGLFVVWRLLWLGGVIYAPCKLLILAAGWNIPDWPLLLFLGFVTTIYTVLGGMKAVIWTDVIQGLMMLGGVFVVIGAIWLQVDGGPAHISKVAAGLGRLSPPRWELDWTSQWSPFGALAHWILAMLSFYIADQITAQRFLSAKSVIAARNSFVLNTLALTALLPGLVYLGICLLVYYHDHPQQMRPEWVANVDGVTRKPITDPATRDPSRTRTNLLKEQEVDPTVGRPLLRWRHADDALTPENIDNLVAAGKLLDPNTKEPFTTSEGLIDPDTREVVIEKLAMRRPPSSLDEKAEGIRPEMVLDKRAAEEILPRFIATRLGWGIAGLIVAALLAASMSSIDSGLNSLCSLLIVDLHRRYGWDRTWLAQRLNKPVQDLNEEDELKLAQPLTLVVGVVATLFSLFIAQLGNVFQIMVAVVNTFGAPLLAIFLLGMFTRRCTAAAAFWALLIGTLFTTMLVAFNQFPILAPLWPLPVRFHDIWSVTFGTLFTLVLGYGLSFVLGTPKSRLDLRGLVSGCGTLGVRATDEEMPIISPPEEPQRWR